MIKKIALAAAVAATASFATYTIFPVGQAHSGQVEVGVQYGWTDNSSNMEIPVAGEFVVIPNLELSITGLGFQLWNDPDDCGEKGHPDCPENSGLKALTFGARYQVMPMVAVALDLNLPFNSEDVVGEYDPFGIYVAGQFSTEFAPGLALGSELGLSYKLSDEYAPHSDRSEGLGLSVQAELDYTIASIGLTPWVGLQYDVRLSDITDEWDVGKKTESVDYGSGDSDFKFWIGAGYAINQMLTVKANFIMKFADDDTMGSDWTGVNAKLDINF